MMLQFTPSFVKKSQAAHSDLLGNSKGVYGKVTSYYKVGLNIFLGFRGIKYTFKGGLKVATDTV